MGRTVPGDRNLDANEIMPGDLVLQARIIQSRSELLMNRMLRTLKSPNQIYVPSVILILILKSVVEKETRGKESTGEGRDFFC